MQNLTPAQIRSLQGWTEQRDSLLRDIGVYSVQSEELQKGNVEKGLASADLDKQIAEKRGRLAELDALEARMRTSLPIDIAELEVRKSRLEGECAVKETELKSAFEKSVIVVAATADLKSAHDTMKDQAAIVNRVVGEVIETSKSYLGEASDIMANIRTVSAEVIEKGNENIKQTGIVLEQLPRYIFELQRPIPVRRRYPIGHPKAVPASETIEPK